MTARQIHLAAFLIAGNGAHSHALWRHPETQPGGFLSAGYYQEVARAVERGLFDLLFLADRLAMSTRYGGSIEARARHGDQDATRLCPIPALTMMAAATSRPRRRGPPSPPQPHPHNPARGLSS